MPRAEDEQGNNLLAAGEKHTSVIYWRATFVWKHNETQNKSRKRSVRLQMMATWGSTSLFWCYWTQMLERWNTTPLFSAFLFNHGHFPVSLCCWNCLFLFFLSPVVTDLLGTGPICLTCISVLSTTLRGFDGARVPRINNRIKLFLVIQQISGEGEKASEQTCEKWWLLISLCISRLKIPSLACLLAVYY